jgi:quinol monooxygenase YgiN
LWDSSKLRPTTYQNLATGGNIYGTIARIRVKAGQSQKVIDLLLEWDRDRGAKVKGALGGYILRPDSDSDGLLMVAIFEDKATYEANAEDPEQDAWFKRLREMLEADPEWTDGEIFGGGTK